MRLPTVDLPTATAVLTMLHERARGGGGGWQFTQDCARDMVNEAAAGKLPWPLPTVQQVFADEYGLELEPNPVPPPPDPEEMNDDRASWAGYALKTFQDVTGADGEDALSDLLCDLMHLCDRRPDLGNFDAMLERARANYKEETTPWVNPLPDFLTQP